MAQEKDPRKRSLILTQAKKLFAAQGFHATSVGSISQACGLPVGSVYTYFANKDEILSGVIEEGWEEFQGQIMASFARVAGPRERLALLVDVFLPRLFDDSELVAILFSEGARLGNFGEKLNTLADLIAQLASELQGASPGPENIGEIRTALLIFLLGSLDAVRLSEGAGLKVSREDVQDFMRGLIRRTFPWPGE